MIINENTVFLITKDSFLTINPDDQFGTPFFYEGEIEENVLGILSPCICTKCNTPNILFGLDGSEVVETDSRQMGTESFFIYDVFSECDNCKSSLHSKFLFNEYANSVTFVEIEEQDNCKQFFISNLLFVAKQFASLLGKQFEHDEDLDIFFDVSKSESCRILVEGKDDKPILDAFLSKLGFKRNQDYVIFSGRESGNGFKGVVNTVYLLKNLKIALPIRAFVDSDNKREEHIKLLREAGATTNEIFVLKKEEIEDYLIDVRAISLVTKKSEKEISDFLSTSKLTGKELLNTLFHRLGLSSPKSETKHAIATNIEQVPDEIIEFSKTI